MHGSIPRYNDFRMASMDIDPFNYATPTTHSSRRLYAPWSRVQASSPAETPTLLILPDTGARHPPARLKHNSGYKQCQGSDAPSRPKHGIQIAAAMGRPGGCGRRYLPGRSHGPRPARSGTRCSVRLSAWNGSFVMGVLCGLLGGSSPCNRAREGHATLRASGSRCLPRFSIDPPHQGGVSSVCTQVGWGVM